MRRSNSPKVTYMTIIFQRESVENFKFEADSFKRFEMLLKKTENFSRCLSAGDVSNFKGPGSPVAKKKRGRPSKAQEDGDHRHRKTEQVRIRFFQKKIKNIGGRRGTIGGCRQRGQSHYIRPKSLFHRERRNARLSSPWFELARQSTTQWNQRHLGRRNGYLK